MKKQILTFSATGILAACTTETTPPEFGMPNPASEYCIAQGGSLEMKKDADGAEYAICHLPDGSAVEEWELYRSQKVK